MFEPHKFDVTVLNASAAEPYIHYAEHDATNNKRDITSMSELLHQCREVCKFNDKEQSQKKIYQPRVDSFRNKVIRKENGCGDHGNNNGQAICCFHTC